MLERLSERSKSSDEPSTSSWVRENFVVSDLIGNGTFGKVYKVNCRGRTQKDFAMKELMRFSHPKHIEMELRVLQELGGVCNVMSMHAAHRERDRVFILMDHFPHDRLQDFIEVMSAKEITDYMKNLFIALQHLHKNGIIHRDVKPANFLYNRRARKYSLIDFGLASRADTAQLASSKENSSYYYHHESKAGVKRLCEANNDTLSPAEKRWRVKCECHGLSSVCDTCRAKPVKNVNKAGTPGFRAPEILLRFDKQTAKIDVWSAGITMLTLLCRKHPLFRPQDDQEALAQIAMIQGTSALVELAQREGYNLIISPKQPGLDLVKLVRCVRSGPSRAVATNNPSPPNSPPCKYCSSIIFDSQGACICKKRKEAIDDLPDKERNGFEVLRRCLDVDPRSRYSSAAALSLLE